MAICNACKNKHHKGCTGNVSVQKGLVIKKVPCSCECHSIQTKWDHNPTWATDGSGKGYPVDHVKWRGHRDIEKTIQERQSQATQKLWDSPGKKVFKLKKKEVVAG